jgi:hypothetical protein
VKLGKLSFRCLREPFKWRTHKNQSTDAQHSGGVMHSSVEDAVMVLEQRHGLIRLAASDNCEAG